MKIISLPDKSQWPSLLERPVMKADELEKTVRKILNKVKKKGDKAIKKLTEELDGVKVKKIQVSQQEIDQSLQLIDQSLRSAIDLAKNNIEIFHRSQIQETETVSTMTGVQCWRRTVAIEKVGLYIPGGTAPLFSTVLMLGIPAKLAGCGEIILCTPPQPDGKINPAIIYAAQISGITKIMKVGGAQAIAAMAYGTETIPKCDKIFGPGNQYVNAAKQLIQSENTAIDMPAGPSEVCVLADDSVNPAWVAADLLSQAEHGPDSQVLLISTSEKIIASVVSEIKQQVEKLPRHEMALKALSHSKAIRVKTLEEGMEISNLYAPEHLIIACREAERLGDLVINAGSVFLGYYSPESVGDYASGTNHVLPTNGFARSYSGVSVDSFVKKITYQQLSREGLQQIGEAVIQMAMAEGLTAHAHAVSIRLEMQD